MFIKINFNLLYLKKKDNKLIGLFWGFIFVSKKIGNKFL